MTQEQLNKLGLPGDLDKINAMLEKYEINTPNRLAGFFAQCAHESINFKAKVENLNYSLKNVLRVFPKYFKDEESAKPYARNPEKLANKVYANRMGNGDAASGEGWMYRGRGYIQLTGKDNYSKFAKACNLSLAGAVTYCETDEGALESALYYWNREKLNETCDKDDIVAMTKKINGGTNGLEDRREKYEEYKQLFADPVA